MIKHTEENQVHRSRVSCLGHVVYIQCIVCTSNETSYCKTRPFLIQRQYGLFLTYNIHTIVITTREGGHSIEGVTGYTTFKITHHTYFCQKKDCHLGR